MLRAVRDVDSDRLPDRAMLISKSPSTLAGPKLNISMRPRTGMTTTINTIEGTAVAFERAGEGPPVVLVHGLTESRRMWDPLIAPLATDHTVVSLDLPGHGQSGACGRYDMDTLVDAVHEVIRAAGLVRPLLVGHSLGASVVTASTGILPCSGVVNIDQRFDFIESRSVVQPLEAALRGSDSVFQRTMREIFEPLAGALDDHERARLEGLREPRQDVVLAIWAPLLEWSREELDAYIRQRTSRVTVPYLSLHGRDPGDAYAAWLSALLPHALVEVWPGVGHYPHLVEPERFVARLRAFERST
jgi:pimeloyl-ACP methyl ester carboxylesterase